MEAEEPTSSSNLWSTPNGQRRRKLHVRQTPIEGLPMSSRKRMGEVTADATVRGPRGASATLRLVVDTGSTYTWIPAKVALQLGIQPLEIATFYLADGRRVRRRLGEAEVQLLGRHGTRFVVFARKGDANVIGVDTLQGLLLQVDPVEHRLRKRRSAQATSPRAVGFVARRRVRRAFRS